MRTYLLIYDYLEEIQTSIVFSYKSLESFCNESIPDEYVYKKTNNKGIVEHYSKEQIERWIPTSEKLSDILPEIFKCDFLQQKKSIGPTSKTWKDYEMK